MPPGPPSNSGIRAAFAKDTINRATGTEDESQGGPITSKALGAVGVTLGMIGLAA